MPLPLLAAIPALLGGIGGAGGILGALGGAGGIMGMIGKILPFGEMLGNVMKGLGGSGSEDSESKQGQAQEGGARAQQQADDFMERAKRGLAGGPLPTTILNLLG